MPSRTVIGALAAAASSTSCFAQFSYTSQDRRVYARTEVWHFPSGTTFSEDEEAAKAFDPFTGDVFVSGNGNVGALADGKTSQVSSLGEGAMSVSGYARAGGKRGSIGTFGGGNAEFDFVVGFDVTERTQGRLEASLEVVQLTGPVAVATASVSLERAGPAGPVVIMFGAAALSMPSFSLHQPVDLPPGAYTLRLEADSAGGGGNTTYNQIEAVVSVELSAECYADCNTDGALTVADFGCFQTWFVAGAPYADCDGNGSLTVADFGCFQTEFVAGCP